MSKQYTYTTNSRNETVSLGEKLGNIVKPNMVILLDGDLGAGKTTFTQGLGKGLGVKRTVTSPTFTIQKIYHGTNMDLFHIDAYRLEGADQDLGFDEFFYDNGLTVIEWSQFIPSVIPDEYLKITIQLLDEDSRQFTFDAKGKEYEALLEDLR